MKNMPFDKSEAIQFAGLSLAIIIITLGIMWRENQGASLAPGLGAQVPQSQILASGDIEVLLDAHRSGHFTFAR